MPDERRWEAAELVAALDPAIAPRLLATHPASGWCRSCRVGAPCSVRGLAEAAGRSGRGSGLSAAPPAG